MYCSNTSENSFLRNNPLFTKMQYRFLPIALCKSIAATDESTPPDNPKTTLSLPNFVFKSSTVSSIKAFGVQSGLTFAIFTKKFSSSNFPSVE